MVRLSAGILAIPQLPAFTGSIEVDITAEDLPNYPRYAAKFGKCYLATVKIILFLSLLNDVSNGTRALSSASCSILQTNVIIN